MTDQADITEPTHPAEKPGWKTTEFWLTLAAVLIAAFLNSGVLPDTSIAVKIASIAAAALASLGYTAGRSYVKGSLTLLLGLALSVGAVSMSGCAGASNAIKTVGQDAFDCGTDAVKAEVANLLPAVTAILSGQSVDWAAQLNALESLGEEALACTIKKVVTDLASAPPTAGESRFREADRAKTYVQVKGWKYK